MRQRGRTPDKAPAAPLRKGIIMKTIAKVIESMLTKDATQQWDVKVISQTRRATAGPGAASRTETATVF